MGVIANDPQLRNFVYASIWGTSQHEQFNALIADNVGNPAIHKAFINLMPPGGPRSLNGTLASPSIHPDNGDVVIPSDDGALYTFDNVTHPSNVLQPRFPPLDFDVY